MVWIGAADKIYVKSISRKTIRLMALLLTLAINISSTSRAERTEQDTEKGQEDSGVSYIRGKELLLKGEFEQALPFLEQACKADPKSSLVNSQLAETYLRLNQIEKAEEFGKKAVELEPGNADYRSTLAGIYASLKKYDEAKDQYKKIIELDPSNTKAPLLIGILEAEKGQLVEGIETLSRILEENPENIMALFYRAKMHIEQDNVEKAKADLDKALTLKPNFVEAGTALGIIHEKLSNTEEAIKVYSRIQGTGSFKKRLAQLYLQSNQIDKALNELLEYQKAEPDDYTARVKIGLIYFEKKDLINARKVFEGILKEEPTADNVRFYLAWVLEEAKELNLALTEFKKVKSDSTLFKESSLHIGFILKEQKKFDEGLKFSKKLIDSNANEEEYFDMHASFLEAKREFAKSLQVVENALVMFPKSEKLAYFKGVLQEKNGNLAGAIATMKSLVSMNPNNYHALNFVAYLYAESGENLEEAESLVKKAMSLKPNDGFIEDTLGWVLFKKGNIKESQQALERAVALQPEEAIIIEHLGDVYERQKEYSKAKEFYKKAVQLAAKKDKDLVRKVEKKIASLSKGVADLPNEKRLPSAQK